MNSIAKKLNKQARRRNRIRARVIGTATRPRLSVFLSNKHVNLQLIDDTAGKTLFSASDLASKKKGAVKKKAPKTELAKEAGRKIAELAVAKKIKKTVFDRGGHKYHGRIKAVAEGAREGGLEF